MTQIHLRIYIDPGEAQVLCNLLRQDGNLEKIAATIVTGAAVSLFPVELLNTVAHRLAAQHNIVIDQAGIASQFFEATEAFVTLSLEDDYGNLTAPFEIRAWFAASGLPLIGFADVLDRAVLHIDMPQRSGWLEIEA